MTGSFIEIATENGESFDGYLSLPASGHGPGMVVIQEIFGVNSHIQSVADDYAAQGYVALAPDMFWRSEPRVELGYTQDDMPKAYSLMQQLTPENTVKDLLATVAALKALPETTDKIGVVGYCLGGRLAFALAATGAVDAAVSYYGGGLPGMLDLVPKIEIPIQFHFGALDTHIPLTDVAKVRDAFAGRPDVDVFVYDEADHGFNCDTRASYNAPSAALAKSRALELFDKALKG
jgi:carboxymethylenebutenolidase